MNNDLTKDEFDALGQVSRNEHRGRASACVARNTKRLTGLKFMEFSKAGHLSLTDKGKQILFIHRCIEALRALAADVQAQPDADVAIFLGRKGHIAPRDGAEGFDVTQRGRESLADIDAQSR
ncbi:hypothetical protein [Herbaspirillum autotrophicum]|uniref:hypothetical protein n=1 Tax=Herbaspirillum autotrophicum TaxID=180195 RepID=UPI00067D9190|nr:hypothetical protein [Herbaspirillum autotrophicum]